MYKFHLHNYRASFTSSYDSSNGTSRQLDYYATYEGAIKNSGGSAVRWWLRSARSNYSNTFYYVGSDGYWSDIASYYGDGVSPAFRLAN